MGFYARPVVLRSATVWDGKPETADEILAAAVDGQARVTVCGPVVELEVRDVSVPSGWLTVPLFDVVCSTGRHDDLFVVTAGVFDRLFRADAIEVAS